MMPEKALANSEKKDRYLQECLERRHNLTTLLFSANGIPGKEVWADNWKMASHISFKLKMEYYEMCGFVRARMELA